MKKAVSILLVLVICLCMSVTAFATNGDQQTGTAESDFVISPGEGGYACGHLHTVIENQKDATCTENGHTGNTVCKDCGEIVEPGKVIPSKGHEYKDGVCTVCGTRYQPTTGDVSIMLWVVLMVLAAAALVVVTTVYRKKV